MIIDGSFELDFVCKGDAHAGIDTNRDDFEPFWEVQYLSNCNGWVGSKEECIEWMADHYVDYFYEKSKTEEEAIKKSLAWVNKCVKKAESKGMS